MTLDPDTLPDPRLSAGLTYWNRIRGDRPMPSRRDIRPADITALLPHVMLVEVLRAPFRFRVRLAGTEVVKRFGEEGTSKTLDEIDLGDRTAAIFAAYAATVAERRPSLATEEFTRHDGRFMHYHRLLCPLSSDGLTVDMLFGVMADSRAVPLP